MSAPMGSRNNLSDFFQKNCFFVNFHNLGPSIESISFRVQAEIRKFIGQLRKVGR